MKVFDFNVHLPKQTISDDANDLIYNERNVSFEDLKISYKTNVLPIVKLLNGLNIMIFNENLFKSDKKTDLFDYIKRSIKNTSFTSLINFRDKRCLEQLERAKSLGVKGLKFHPYVQKITQNDMDLILKMCKRAQELNMFISIDTSFGTLKLYDNDNLKMATYVASQIKISPIILLHSGGARVLEAMLIAESQKNIYLETSFSLLYYRNSSIEKDFAFAYKKIGSDRVIYGSDAPYVDAKESASHALKYFQNFGFKDMEIENIFFNTANRIVNE